jgi:hypothetical protein
MVGVGVGAKLTTVWLGGEETLLWTATDVHPPMVTAATAQASPAMIFMALQPRTVHVLGRSLQVQR